MWRENPSAGRAGTRCLNLTSCSIAADHHHVNNVTNIRVSHWTALAQTDYGLQDRFRGDLDWKLRETTRLLARNTDAVLIEDVK